MTKITIELPDDLAARLAALPEIVGDLNAFAVAALTDAADAVEHAEPDTELLSSLRSGYADLDAGNVMNLAEAREHFDNSLSAALTRAAKDAGRAGT